MISAFGLYPAFSSDFCHLVISEQ